jgi:hypothetical protein
MNPTVDDIPDRYSVSRDGRSLHIDGPISCEIYSGPLKHSVHTDNGYRSYETFHKALNVVLAGINNHA